jgi:hypothetical protein
MPPKRRMLTIAQWLESSEFSIQGRLTRAAPSTCGRVKSKFLSVVSQMHCHEILRYKLSAEYDPPDTSE